MGYSENNDEIRLALLVGQGDSAAMKNLYHGYVGYLTAVCSRYLACEEDVKDVLQDSFVKIFTSIDKFEYRGEGSLKAWMARIVVNESLKFLKKGERLENLQYEGNLPDIPDEEDPDFNDIPVSVIQKMIQELPVGYRTIFNLYVMENKSHKEIAEMLKIKENTSASQFHRAKAMLARKIKEYNSAHHE